MELDKLEEAGYHYQIWKRGNKDDEQVVIAQCTNFKKDDTLEVACKVPNDTWYFEIIPENGWITSTERYTRAGESSTSLMRLTGKCLCS